MPGKTSPLLLLAALLLALCVSACLKSGEPVDCPVVPGEQVAAVYIEGQGVTGISGQVMIKSSKEPLAGAFVNIYPDTISNLLGPSQFISSPTDAAGRYNIPLPPGTYYVVARKRMTGQSTGPLAPGDFYSEHQRIVTRVVAGKLAVVDLAVVAMKAPMFFKKEVVERETATGIRGRLVDGSGKAVPGGFAMAYTDPTMKRLPDFASTLSDADGRFTIYLPDAGTFYLAARIHAWDMPQHGEPYGKLGGDQPTPLSVVAGQFIEGVVIKLEPFAGEYLEGKSRRPF
ncbi:MAG: hypothetical protein A2091_10530 [Desulfuromonadales bacterium GWD2_61_12]|nr:MAG: hypothetical protein A2091_10530 [Desulfuromonadales bacterium GWD2_61_12]HBT83250.1 hypothetical protein [Desulfuromonas sp.]